MNRLLIIGPPGAGKGTQAVKIAENLSIPAISTGDIFRKNIKEETELGKEAKSYIDSGNLVPDSVTNKMVRSRLSEDDAANGFLLDGYPRNTAQVHELDSILSDLSQEIDRVLLLVADNDELVQRLLNRAAEQGRSDDNEEVIRHRLKVYEKETEPLLAIYRERGLVKEVNGLGEIDEVTQRILEALK
ncbi:adenylate kinase [Rothia aerolata]|uniref:Adenylate kinase n=1 Tax=Rothia aerolata TaxID=1812262 RepID=A0A917IQ42_9MICC|nr:adenylate kinase [Rothia aerolata]GGH60433.1 adenylate kinase [Rothia aerolata]